MTRVVHFYELGGPDVLHVEDADLHEPGQGEVRVALHAVGLNRAEASFRRGRYFVQPPTFPSSLGNEGAGVVDALGPDVEGLSVGDDVSILPTFSMTDYTVYGEHALVPASSLLRRPPELDAITGAAVWMPYLTAWGALIDLAALSANDAVLITAASSSVGLAAIQLATSVGATPIAVTRTSTKKARLEQHGIRRVIATDEQDPVAEVNRITADRGARVVFDPIAGPGIETLAAATARKGTIFVYGSLSGQPTPFPRLAVAHGLTMRGYLVFEITADQQRLDRGRAFILDGLRSGQLVPTVDRTFAFNDIAEAHHYLESNTHVGKIVITV